MNRRFRIRSLNKQTNIYDTLFPQTLTENILRRDDGGVLESYLNEYDHHMSDPVFHFNRAYSYGTHRHLKATVPGKVLGDDFPLLLTLHTELDCDATLDLNDSGPKPIINGAGERIPGGQVPGAIMLMVYSESKNAWIMLSNDNYSELTRLVTPIEHQYWYEAQTDGESIVVIPEFDRHTMKINYINYGQSMLLYGRDFDFDWNQSNAIKFHRFNLVKGDLLQIVWTSYSVTTRRGTMKYDLRSKTIHTTVEKDGEQTFVLPSYAETATNIRVIYGQTLLREGLDYTYNHAENEVKIIGFNTVKDDIVSFDITELVEVDGDIVPNNWGATGTYRYSMHVLHGEYTAENDHITVIPVPKYDHLRDEITVIRDNHMLVYDVDYTIDTLDQIVLLTGELMKEESIHWTILKGAMFDVPNFNVITASGNSGQHILVDIQDEMFCNFYVLLIRLTHDLQTAPTLKGIGGPARPIADCYGNPVLEGYKAGSFLWCVFNEDNQTWYSLGHGQMDITTKFPTTMVDTGIANFFGNHGASGWYDDNHSNEVAIPHKLGVKPEAIDIMPIEPPMCVEDPKVQANIGDIWTSADNNFIYVGNTGNATSRFQWRVTNQTKTTNLAQYLETELNKLKQGPGNIINKLQVVTIEENDTTFIEVDWFNSVLDKLLVNYGQTILREDIDWVRETLPDGRSGIKLLAMSLSEGDMIQFNIIRQDPIDLTPGFPVEP